MSRGCINNPNNFCYVCGEYTVNIQRRNITSKIRKSYELYFGCKIGDQDKSWAPHICCASCVTLLFSWLNGKSRHMPFAIPMIWREQKDHSTDCYFCMTNLIGIRKQFKKSVIYPIIPSAIRPIPHNTDLPIPVPPQTCNMQDAHEFWSDPEQSASEEENDTDFLGNTRQPHLIRKAELNDLVRDLNMSKKQAELLASRLRGWNLLEEGVKICTFRQRQQEFENLFSMQDGLVFCSDVNTLFNSLGQENKPGEWRLFMDSSKTSLKAVLLHNGNHYPSIPIAYAAQMKETYENMKFLLTMIQYEKYSWYICADLKVIAIVLGLQPGYTKFCCFLCEWNSRDKQNHFIKKDWTPRDNYTPGNKNILYEPLVKPEKVYLPPLHIKLGLMKNFVKAMDRNGTGFQYLRSKFPRLSDAKIKEGIFVGPQIRNLMKDVDFERSLNNSEKPAWRSFQKVVEQFLGNEKTHDYKEVVGELIENYKALGSNMSLKIHFLDSHLNFFPNNLGAVSDEHGERFHQDISVMESRYRGKVNSKMLSDYCWTLKREVTQDKYRRNSRKKHF